MQLQLINVSLLLQNQVTLVQNLFAILGDFSKKHKHTHYYNTHCQN